MLGKQDTPTANSFIHYIHAQHRNSASNLLYEQQIKTRNHVDMEQQ